jgi:3-oxoacyl-[acyl-carrier-protein] synthase II
MGNGKKNPHEVRVVITGLGTINPLGNNVEEYWDNLLLGKSGVRLVQDEGLSEYNVRIASEIDLPDISDYFPERKMLKRLDRHILLAHVAGTQAMRDAGLDVEKAPHRYGSMIGTSGGLMAHYDNIKRIMDGNLRGVSAFYIVSALPNTAAGYFAKEWNLQGPCFSVTSACATSNHSIGQAVSLIKMGVADAIFAGGSEAAGNIIGLVAFDKINALSRRNDSPETASRPFDKDRDGFVLGEGAGVFCLEELEHAKTRGARIYGEITGVGFSCDAYDLAAPHPEGRGAAQAMQSALESAQLGPEEIGLINAHATSTPLGDLSETMAINKAFGEHATKVLVHSTKSMIGHTLGAAGAAEGIAALMAFERGLVHHTTNQFEQDPEISLNVVKDKPLEAEVNHILSNGFGFGGQNASLVISRFKD